MTGEEREREILARIEALTEEVAALRGRMEESPDWNSKGESALRFLEEAGEKIEGLWNRGVDEIARSERRSPLGTAALAFGAGLLLGTLARRK